ncbi:MAG: hypothetical protein EOP90_05330 [Lysobacteraceae bacterium]|nr:MAG: hypothetical protein EOP90_05330 [Xanthomonadaceae bacterium]
MNLPEPERIAALAQRLALTPRQLLVLAARAARSDMPVSDAALARDIARLRAARDLADAAGERMLLGYARYAFDDIDNGLSLAWTDVAGLDP